MWTTERIRSFYKELNETYGLQVNPTIREAKKGKFPLFRKNGELIFVPAFFNHDGLDDAVRMTLLIELYACCHLDRRKTGYVDVDPGFLAKGISRDMEIAFMSDDTLEQKLRAVRRQLFDDTEHSCYFSVGQTLRESAWVKWEVTDIVRNSREECLVTVKPIGCNLGKPPRTMSEETLFSRCCCFRDMSDERVDMRRNLVVISGPSGVGKDTVVKQLLKDYPFLHKTVSVTTRHKRSTETDGVDYYFISKDRFYEYQTDGSLAEYELYNGQYYGTLYSEVERHPDNVPLILVIDVRGRREITMRYPMARSIFIAPPSLEALEERIRARGEHTPDELKRRLTAADDELRQAHLFDATVINDEVTACAQSIARILGL